MEPHEVIWETHPSGISAIRTVSRARRDQGEVDRIVEDFERAPALDPLHAVARVGTAAACEEREGTRAAWDLTTALDRLRDEPMRLRSASVASATSIRCGPSTPRGRRGVPLGDAASAWRTVLANVETGS